MRMLKTTLFLLLVFQSIFSSAILYAKQKITVDLSQSDQQVWQRQQVLITLTVQTDDPFSRLEVDDFSEKGFSIIPFELQRTESNQQTTLTLKWVIFPFVSGKHSIELPRIRYRPNSGRIQTLQLKPLPLQVRKLPIYVPPTMPVGEIILQSKWDESWLVSTKSLLEWQVTMQGKQLAKQTMPPLTRQLSSNKSLEILPLQTTNEMIKSDQGFTHLRNYTIPLKAIKTGLLNLPTLEVQYFEPIAGKLQTAQLSPPFVLSINKWLLRAIGILLLIAVVLLLFFITKMIATSLRKSAKIKQALHQLKQATTYEEVRDALNQLALAKGWENNLSLSQFIDLWQEQSRDKGLLTDAIKTLQSQQFSPTDNNKIKDTAQMLWKALTAMS
ncbi:MAG TPA: hypothetical protein EYG71_01695 [Leucothrix sp.]|nr:hypothetical protein [Leucothrix sp.]